MEEYKKTIIDYVQARPLLWDPSHPDYKNRDERKQVWSAIDVSVKAPPGADAKTTWALLTKCFANALRRKNRRSIAGADEREWKFEKDLMFLLPAKQIRQISAGNSEFQIESNEHSALEDFHDSQEGDIEASQITVEPDSDDSEEPSYYYTEESIKTEPTVSNGTNHTYKRKAEEKQGKNEMQIPVKKRREDTTNESPRMNFFRSLMETVDSLDEFNFMNFQIDVIEALKKNKAIQQQIQLEQFQSISQ